MWLCFFLLYQLWHTRRYGALWVPTSSSCGGLVAFSHLEGPSALWIAVKKIGPPFFAQSIFFNFNFTPFFYRGPSYTPPPPTAAPPPTPCTEYFFYFFLPPFFYRGPPYTPPHCHPPPPAPYHRVFFLGEAILDFEVDVKNVTHLCKKCDGGKGREGDQAQFFMWIS